MRRVIQGRFCYADMGEAAGDVEMEIRVQTEDGKAVTFHRIDVPMGLGDGIMRDFGEEVEATVDEDEDRLVLVGLEIL